MQEKQTSSSGDTTDGLRFAILDVTRAMNPVGPAEKSALEEIVSDWGSNKQLLKSKRS